jgi:putative hemolysin
MATAEQLDDLCSGIRSGDLEVRLASSPDEIEAAQALRYQVFYGEMDAVPSEEMFARKRDIDAFDATCQHLLVLDSSRNGLYESVVGTYRLNRREQAAKAGGFYTAKEYDISTILRQDGELLELGRSCVATGYRNGHTMALLWRGLAAYVFEHDVAWLFGCASLKGIDLQKLALPLSYLHHYHLAPEAIRPRALEEHFSFMGKIPKERIEKRLARELLPPLIKGYLRVGCFVGDGAVVDQQFQTTDVCIILKTDRVTDKYRQHYENSR